MAAIILNLECITNMHVGNGDVNFNIIDNEVERDVVTNYPTINSSGVKGAIREYFEKKQKAKDGVDQTFIDDVFGKDKTGKLRFLNADMLAMPARASGGDSAYYLLTTAEALNAYKEKYNMFLKKDASVTKGTTTDRFAEGCELKETATVLGKELHVVSDDTFRGISLPVLARNKLDDGKSVNLWYEEIVPHKSVFTIAVLAEDTDKELLKKFGSDVNNQIIQFGGNASIGYGLCKVTVEE